MDQLTRQLVDVVVVAPADVQANVRGRQALADRRPGQRRPTRSQASYAIFLARGLEAAVNRQIIEQAVTEGEGYAISQGAARGRQDPAGRRSRRRPRPTVENVAQSQPTVVQYFAPAVLALILQHLAVTLIALSVVRERNSGLFELFRISPITTAELVTGKLVAYGLFAGAVAFATIAPARRRASTSRSSPSRAGSPWSSAS